MSDIKKTFHESALESILFKGRHDWYFCFLKSEKIAHVLALLAEKIHRADVEWFEQIVSDAGFLPQTIVHFVAGETDVQVVLAEIFSLLTAVRLSATRGYISKENALYIAGELELMAEKMAAGNRVSPFVSAQDFSVPDFLERVQITETLSLGVMPEASATKFSGTKNVQKNQSNRTAAQGQPKAADQARATLILDFVLKNKAVSIKDICAVVPDCSEKTVQRELIALIGQGRIKREGERRWSIYKPA